MLLKLEDIVFLVRKPQKFRFFSAVISKRWAHWTDWAHSTEFVTINFCGDAWFPYTFAKVVRNIHSPCNFSLKIQFNHILYPNPTSILSKMNISHLFKNYHTKPLTWNYWNWMSSTHCTIAFHAKMLACDYHFYYYKLLVSDSH